MKLNILFTDPIVDLLKWQWLEDISFGSIIFRLILALLCGGILGIERAKKHHAAGLRTYIIVCIGSTIAMMTNEFICAKSGLGDGARLGAQVISGIGFLGAGTILVTSRNQIRGLTTAAGLWGCACLGLAVGVGFYTLAILGAILIIIIFAIMPKIEGLFTKNSKTFQIHIEFECRANLKEFIDFARNNLLKINSIDRNEAYSSSGLSVYTIFLMDISKNKKTIHKDYIDQFKSLSYVNYVEEIY